MNWPWSELGLDGPAPLSEIRRAYAQRTKETHPEEDPEGFQRLHDAYQSARAIARGRTRSAYPKESVSQRPPDSAPPQEESPTSDPTLGNSGPSWDETPIFSKEAESRQKQPNKPENVNPTWDYERIFAEEDQRQEEEQRQRRIAMQARTGLTDETDDWTSVLTALQTLHNLEERHFPMHLWLDFLHSPLFGQVAGNLGFVTALEDWLETRPTLSKEASNALLSRLGITAQYVPPLYFMIYMRISSLSPGAVSQPVYYKGTTQNQRKRWQTLAPVFLIAAPAAMILALICLSIPFRLMNLGSAEERSRAEIGEWLTHDFSLHIELADETNTHGQSYTENSYVVREMPGLIVQAVPDSSRDLEHNQPGYVTNLPSLALHWSIQNFVSESGYTLQVQREDISVQTIYDSIFHYHFEVPPSEAVTFITQMKEFYQDLEETRWYQAGTPHYFIDISHLGVSYYACSIPDESFDPPTDDAFYTHTVPQGILMVILQTTGLDEADFGVRDYELFLFSDQPSYDQFAAIDSITKDVLRIYAYSESAHCVVSYPPENLDPRTAFEDLLIRAEPFLQQKQCHMEFPKLFRWSV